MSDLYFTNDPDRGPIAHFKNGSGYMQPVPVRQFSVVAPSLLAKFGTLLAKALEDQFAQDEALERVEAGQLTDLGN